MVNPKVVDPDAPATAKQTYYLYTLTKEDFRTKNLTRQQASDMIQKILHDRQSAEDSKKNLEDLSEDFDIVELPKRKKSNRKDLVPLNHSVSLEDLQRENAQLKLELSDMVEEINLLREEKSVSDDNYNLLLKELKSLIGKHLKK